MAERCKYAYRNRGDVSVHCKLLPKDSSWCGHQYMCPNSQRWEVNKAAQCSLRNKGVDKTKSK